MPMDSQPNSTTYFSSKAVVFHLETENNSTYLTVRAEPVKENNV